MFTTGVEREQSKFVHATYMYSTNIGQKMKMSNTMTVPENE
jgi:hypothetical protein